MFPYKGQARTNGYVNDFLTQKFKTLWNTLEITKKVLVMFYASLIEAKNIGNADYDHDLGPKILLKIEKRLRGL